MKILSILALLPPCFSLAQKPDFHLPGLYRLGSRSGQTENALDANVSVYCDGTYISVVAEVKDTHISLHPKADLTDRIELWMALPASVYPANFEYQLHPSYIEAAVPAEGTSGGSRFFGTYAELASHLDLKPFLSDFDYPTPNLIKQNNLQVPGPGALKPQEVHFGMVQYGLYADQRPAVLLNQPYFAPLEQSLHIQPEEWAEGIVYTVDMLDEGYVINAEISCQALGFVQLPELHQLRFMVDVVDVGKDGRARPCLTTTPGREVARPATFSLVNFDTPLYTNYTHIPDHVLKAVDYHPVCVFRHQQWVPTGIDTDALVYRENEASKFLTETKFFEQDVAYHSYSFEGFPVESLKIAIEPVNQQPLQLEYYLLQGEQVVTAEQTRQPGSPADDFSPTFFRFPDGQYGAILKTSRLVDPYGWNTGGMLTEESISIYRIAPHQKTELLRIHQGKGEIPYCQIGPYAFDGFLVTGFDWVKEGKMLVLRLDSQSSPAKKRVKVQWNSEGERLKIEPVEDGE
ncbi:MAG: hypothetical protein D6730_21970 [Bacteroidetes bacterium]|nr:MAG: hypothetical protein D6730_21970 [Bacteroidota bacterium]